MKQSEATGRRFTVRKTTIKATQQTNAPGLKSQQPTTIPPHQETSEPQTPSQQTFNRLRTSMLKEKIQQEPQQKYSQQQIKLSPYLVQLKNAENQIHLLQNQNQELIYAIQTLEQKLKEAADIRQRQERKIKEQTEEVHHWLKKIKDQEDITKKQREKKKSYKKKSIELSQQLVQAQQQSMQGYCKKMIEDPLQQLLEMRSMLLQLRMQAQLIPILQAQFRIRQYQNGEVDVDNMTYEELLQLGQNIGQDKKRLAREDIKRIRKRLVLPHDSLDMCTVCQHNLESGERYRRLSCNHCYHAKCIKGWLLNHKTCPLCKVEVTVPS